MVGMVILSFVLGYPLFIFIAYLLARVLFPDLDRVAEAQKKERASLLLKAKRVNAASRRKVSAPVFTLGVTQPKMISQ